MGQHFVRGYEYQSDFARKYFFQGKAEGKEEGRAEGEVRALLNVLEARGLAISDAQKERIRACTDLEVLDRWTRRAVSVMSVDELFNE